jgi:hypothetical protein
MKGNNRIVLAVACLALAALACNAVMGGGNDNDNDNGGGGADSPTSTPSPKIILSDDFSSEQWGTKTDADSSIEYSDNALRMIVYTKQWFVWSTPNADTYQDVHVEVTAMNNNTDSTTAMGIICYKQPSTSNFYYVAITPAGEYAIAKAVEGESDVFLTNNDQWANSDAIAQNASSYRIAADCGNGTITLYVDGQQIASVSDTSYTSGGVALLAWSGEEATNTDISYDDFVMTELP